METVVQSSIAIPSASILRAGASPRSAAAGAVRFGEAAHIVSTGIPLKSASIAVGAPNPDRSLKGFPVSRISTRLSIGFAAGFLSHLTFEGALGAGLYAADLVPALPWSLKPVAPLGVPQVLSLGFWAGLLGVAYALLEPRLTAFFGRWPGGLLFGLAGPLLVDWFVALPLKGHGVGGGFHAAAIPVDIALNAALGIGAVVVFWSGLALARRGSLASPEALQG